MAYEDLETFIFKASGAVTVTAAGATVTVPAEFKHMAIICDVTAKGGTTSPTLDVKMQFSLDKTNWYDAIHANGTTAMAFSQYADASGAKTLEGQVAAYPYMRIYSTIGGTGSPTFTFSVIGVSKPDRVNLT